MLSEVLKLRLSSLRRGHAEPTGGRTGLATACADASVARVSSDLAECFPEGVMCQTPYGDVFACDVSLKEIYSEASDLVEAYVGVFTRAAEQLGADGLPQHVELLGRATPHTTALIDTETAGFHGRPLFLIGLVRYDGDDLILTQYFARDYTQEAALLGQFASLLPQVDLMISFNGKAFDWPFIRDRMVYHRLRTESSFAHLDLLHPSRRRWRAQLPNCQLKTLERHLCGRWRSGDVPSHEIPQRYHCYVREQDARVIAPVFHHNRLDLITMVELLVALSSGGTDIDDERRTTPPLGRR
jgi:uncharacterized protein YprB with RNaseH-like and TPR domain